MHPTSKVDRDKHSEQDLNDVLARKLGYQFENKNLLQQALTHKSYVNKHHQDAHNERLEFLGDAIFQFLVSDLLSQLFSEMDEGILTRMRAVLVGKGGLAKVARQLELGQHLRMGQGEHRSGLANRDSLLGDALEALVAAVYLDSYAHQGMEAVRKLVKNWFNPQLNQLPQLIDSLDHKSHLQEWTQKYSKRSIRYRVIQEAGPAHNKHFMISVWVGDHEYASGEGSTKQQAEQAAAAQALQLLQQENLNS